MLTEDYGWFSAGAAAAIRRKLNSVSGVFRVLCTSATAATIVSLST